MLTAPGPAAFRHSLEHGLQFAVNLLQSFDQDVVGAIGFGQFRPPLVASRLAEFQKRRQSEFEFGHD